MQLKLRLATLSLLVSIIVVATSCSTANARRAPSSPPSPLPGPAGSLPHPHGNSLAALPGVVQDAGINGRAARLSSSYLSGLLSTTGPSASGASGLVSPPGIYDPSRRFVILHGVNAVYKRPPYELYVDPGKPWNFDASDAAHMAELGFNVVRLGILWQGIEPGTLGPNNPKVCTKGQPGDPHQWNQEVADRYIQPVVQTVNLLASYHIYTLLDMHKDVYSQLFGGEGAPAWAVCTNGLPFKRAKGRWSNNYATPQLNAATRNFWSNDVIGNLQGQFAKSWDAVAAAFVGNPWIAGYDVVNEPFTTSVSTNPTDAADVELECFYTGTAYPPLLNGKPLSCGPDIPRVGLIPSIRAVDPNHMIFPEPTIYQYKQIPNFLSPMPYPNLVINFHAYCGGRNPVTGNPFSTADCFNEMAQSVLFRTLQEASNSSPYQPQGLPLFMSEFGATRDTSLLAQETSAANLLSIGWIYWAWKFYNDPTGSSAEGMISANGKDGPQVAVLRQAYPEAVAGTVTDYLSDPTTGILYLSYQANPNVTAPTLIWIGANFQYTHGYCTGVGGGTVVSKKNAKMLEIANPPQSSKVVVAVFPRHYCSSTLSR